MNRCFKMNKQIQRIGVPRFWGHFGQRLQGQGHKVKSLVPTERFCHK